MILAQISDTHILSTESDQAAARLRAESLRRCVADINRCRPDAVVITGDTVQHGRRDEYARLRDLLAPLEAPLYLVPGNRDETGEMRAAFADHTYLSGNGEFLNYVIDRYPVRLVGLDSTLAGERKGRFCERRQAWLDQILGAQPDRPTLLLVHHPPFDVGRHYVGGYRRPREALAFADIVKCHPQVIGTLCGHVHWPVACEWAGTQARIVPSVAVDVRKGVDEAVARGRPIYLLHHLNTKSGLVSQWRTAETAV